MQKLSDFVANFLFEHGIKLIFLISGGGNIHLIDSVGKSKIKYVCNHHEQASAIAAEGYARTTNHIGACMVTTGPGGTNAITGVMGAWLDSIPMIVISGQVKRELIGSGTKLGVRQLGSQEINIVDMVKPITKHAVTIMDPNDIRYHLEKAIYLAKNGKQGPVWIDIPLDVQAVRIDPSKLKYFSPQELVIPYQTNKKNLSNLVEKVIQRIKSSLRPVLYAGNGIRLSGAANEFLELINLLKLPVQSSYVGYDLISSDHPYFFGRAHAFGQRSANFIIQNSDLLLSIGARLDILTTGFSYKAFAREAYKIMVDIDKNEINKPTLSIDMSVNYDAKEFIVEMIRQLKKNPIKLQISEWLDYGRKLKDKYPNVEPSFWKEKNSVNPYCFIETIGKYLNKNEIIVLSDGIGPLNCMYQAFPVKRGQRVILNLGCAQMGYGLPAAIGACFANNKKRIICFEGDGSLQLNIQELQVMKHHALPIKLFVYSNGGYLSIRNTQNGLFGGKHVASGPDSGVTCPDYVKIGKAYGIKTIRINNHRDMVSKIKKVLEYPGPILCDINSVKDLVLTPKLQTLITADGKFVSPTLENMAPFLDKNELEKNMIIPMWEDSQ